jgi:hypothetical protein
MFYNTMPLLKENFAAIDNIILLDANGNNQLITVAIYNKDSTRLDIYDNSPAWFKNDLKSFIENYLAELKIEQPRAKPWESDPDHGHDYRLGCSDRFPAIACCLFVTSYCNYLQFS